LRFLTNDSELQNEPTPGTSAREGRSIQRARAICFEAYEEHALVKQLLEDLASAPKDDGFSVKTKLKNWGSAYRRVKQVQKSAMAG
jgi:hypothetical protein